MVITTGFIFLSMVEVAIVCFVEHKQQIQRRKRENDRKHRRFEEYRRSKMQKKTSKSFDENPMMKHTSYGSLSTTRPILGENEYETARFQNPDTLFVEETNGGLFPNPRKQSNNNLYTRPKSPANFDQLHLLAALSLGLTEGTMDGDSDGGPKWTGDMIDSFCRKAFPCAFVLIQIVYWIYYLTENHFAKERALGGNFNNP
uniref:Neurotransmitter-gated ion-channel transmembrane domain-containing protein n=1 Tax=Panagrolaimus sp. JU765 TaxID=591449 RepID=A0AC34QZN6_9BILA